MALFPHSPRSTRVLPALALLSALTLHAVAGSSPSALAASPRAPMTEFFVAADTRPMYVQHWRPLPTSQSKKGNVVLVHGGSHTGVAWTTMPDGRAGWAKLFVDRGWDVFVVDWPGVGRSGAYETHLADTPVTVVDALLKLLEQIGPSAVVGHSIGAAVAIKAAERRPELVRALAAMAPASAETPGTVVPPAPVDRPSWTTREAAVQRFANTQSFPQHAFENYYASLVPYSSRIRNAAIGITEELKVDTVAAPKLWNKRIPTMILVGEEDRTVPPTRMSETARAMGVPMTMLGADWNMPGHGHLFIVEKDAEKIGGKVEAWLRNSMKH